MVKSIKHVTRFFIRILRESVQEEQDFFLKDHLSGYISKFGWKIGDFSYGNPKVFGANSSKLEIGKFCSLSQGVTFLLDGHNSKHLSTFPFHHLNESGYDMSSSNSTIHSASKGDIVVGNDVWIGIDATILSGVRIGNGVIIGANSVIRESVPDYSIVTGNPARIIGYRFQDDIRKKLLELSWWNLPSELIFENKNLFAVEPNVESISKIEKLRNGDSFNVSKQE